MMDSSGQMFVVVVLWIDTPSLPGPRDYFPNAVYLCAIDDMYGFALELAS